MICPWTIYQAYGDMRLLEAHYPSMVKWVECCTQAQHEPHPRQATAATTTATGSRSAPTRAKELIGTAYFAYSTQPRGQGRRGARQDRGRRHLRVTVPGNQGLVNKYVSPDGRIQGNTQCGYVMALKFDLLPIALRAKAADYLEADIIAKDYHLSTGFVGVSYLLPELTKAGKIDTAYRLLLQDTFPSWLFSVKMGATTIWERWDGWTPDKGFQDVGHEFLQPLLARLLRRSGRSRRWPASIPMAPALRK